MTGTEMIVIGGGLVLGYWIVAVFVPSLLKTPEADQDEINDDSSHESSGQSADADNSSSTNNEIASQKWFEVLEVKETATHEEIVDAYKLKISQYHPDKVTRMGPDIRLLAEAKSKEINAAYATATKSRR